MDYTATEVYGYLIYLKKYLFGDLDTFHIVANMIEQSERDDLEVKTNPAYWISGKVPVWDNNSGSMYRETFTSSSESTRYPDASTESKKPEPKYFRGTIPHALTLFSTVDIVGYLLREKKDYGATSSNFEEFFKHCALSPEEETVLVNEYRHGMSHGYFPKLGLAISYHSSNPGEKLFFLVEGEIVLDMNYLEKIVKEKLELVIESKDLYPQMENQFNHLTSDYKNKCEPSIQKLKEILKK